MVSATPRIDKFGIEARADPLDRLQQLAESLQREEFALQRHEHRIGRDQRVERQQAERRRTIDQADVPVGVGAPSSACVEPMRAVLEVDQLDLGAGQVDRRRDDVEPRHLGRARSLRRASHSPISRS